MQKSTDYTTSSVILSKDGFQKLIDNDDGKNLHWTSDINVELPIKMPSTGKVSEF